MPRLTKMHGGFINGVHTWSQGWYGHAAKERARRKRLRKQAKLARKRNR